MSYILMIISLICVFYNFFSRCSFIYFEEVKLTVESVCELLYCATKCMVTELGDHCRRFIDKRLNSGNVCLFLDRVHLCYCSLRGLIRHRIAKFYNLQLVFLTHKFTILSYILYYFFAVM